MKVLVIDDEEDIRTIASLALSTVGGMDVVQACNGWAGVAAAKEEAPDAILLDVMMPELDGPGTLRELRLNAGTAGIPVIFLTAKAQKAELEELHSLGASGVLTKPFDPVTLSQDIRNILEARNVA